MTLKTLIALFTQLLTLMTLEMLFTELVDVDDVGSVVHRIGRR